MIVYYYLSPGTPIYTITYGWGQRNYTAPTPVEKIKRQKANGKKQKYGMIILIFAF
jgi:hypothetical protein